VEKRTVTLQIAGATYRMTSDAEEGHLERLAEMINARIEALGAKASRSATPAQVLAVVALGLADDLVSAEHRQDRLVARTREVLTDAVARIDARLEADATS
jgi:cell division protein ZapA (FtsZ GTPase activity inhibitor)